MCCFSFLFWQSESVTSSESLCLVSLLLLRSAGRFPPVFHFSSLLGGAQNSLRASLNADCNKKKQLKPKWILPRVAVRSSGHTRITRNSKRSELKIPPAVM